MPQHPDDAARRAYWTEMLDQADAFMDEVMVYPVEECGEPVVSMPEAADAAGVEVVVSDRPHSYGLPRRFLLREGLAPRLLAAAREMNERGWVLKIEDGYRTLQMQQGLGLNERIFGDVLHMVQWECQRPDPPLELMCRRLGALIANFPKVGTHMSGSALDVSVLSRDTGAEVDRGAPYTDMSERTPMASPFVSDQAQQNRREITALMARHGFVAYPWEFWHYSDGDAYAQLLNRSGQPGRYGAVSVDFAAGSVTAIAEPCEPLNPPEVIRDLAGRLATRG